MKKFSALILIGGDCVEGLENYEAVDFVQAVHLACAYAFSVGGRVLRVESCDFGAVEFMR